MPMALKSCRLVGGPEKRSANSSPHIEIHKPGGRSKSPLVKSGATFESDAFCHNLLSICLRDPELSTLHSLSRSENGHNSISATFCLPGTFESQTLADSPLRASAKVSFRLKRKLNERRDTNRTCIEGTDKWLT